MWLELTDTLGHRTIVNMSLVVSIKAAPDGYTILETAAPVAGALHVVVVREGLDEILRLMEQPVRGNGALAAMPAANGDADFVSDGHEG
jgi:hypothetical protein